MVHPNQPVPPVRHEPLYADVIVPRHIAKAFTYLVPAALTQTLTIGRQVLVPFGRTMLDGVVIALSNRPPSGIRAASLKEIRSLADGSERVGLPPVLFDLSRRVAEHYVAPWGQCLRLVLPKEPVRASTRGQRTTLMATGPDGGGIVESFHHVEPDPLWVAQVAGYLCTNQARKVVFSAPWEQRVVRLAEAIRQVHTTGKSTIIVCGELAKAEWLTRQVSHLTTLPITLARMESGFDLWRRAQEGTPSIVVGTRSAVFAPLPSLGLIWIEGEDDPALKEPQEPRYHARDVAWMRAKEEGALVVLASAHPSLESVCDGDAERYVVRLEPARRPKVELVDLRHEPAGTLFSRTLMAAMQEALEHKTGVLLFLNRKGFARTLICRDCGWVPRCPSCAVALAYGREAGVLACRYCGRMDALPQSCPVCHSTRLTTIGDGTERAEADARRLFPHATVARVDRDTLHRAAAVRQTWEGIRSGAWDIVIGTQALFQRGPLPRRGVVGILQADSGLHIPDFRAAERTYQLLDEAVAVARPYSEGGRVIVQTRLPAHHAVEAVLSADPQRFYDEELAARRLLNYPPGCHLAALSVLGKDQQEVETAAKRWRSCLEQSAGTEGPPSMLGPVPAMGKRPKGLHRFQTLVKGTDHDGLCRLIQTSVARMEQEYRRNRLKFVVDIDPMELG
ncbi:MAG: primosomal protein N' [Nitrospira sp.]|nr:primosomal protein N' [Nitrospira sp.]